MLGWFSRLRDSIGGVLVGGVLGIGSVALLWFNEASALERAEALHEGRKVVVEAQADAVDTSQDGALVHVTGDARTQETLTDPQFRLQRDAVRLRRKVEMYQWVERRRSRSKRDRDRSRSSSRKDPRDYEYSRKWDDKLHKSDRFADPAGHQNPSRFEWKKQTFSAQRVDLGARRLGGLVKKMKNFQTESLTEADMGRFPSDIQRRGKVYTGILYVGAGGIPADPQNPRVGDSRVTFQTVPPGPVSVIAKQEGKDFAPYVTSGGGELYMLHTGTYTAKQMFTREESANTMKTWILRFVGFLLMVFAFSLLTRPLVVFLEVIPILGGLIGAGIGFFSLLAAAFCSLLVIAVAWFAVRPMLSMGLLALGVALVVIGRAMFGGKAASGAPAEPAPPAE